MHWWYLTLAILAEVLATSALKAAEAQLRQAQKMEAIGQLAGGVAHDFNNILTAIIGHCDLMLMRHTPGDSDYDDIQQIKSNSNRAAGLTRQLLAKGYDETKADEIFRLIDWMMARSLGVIGPSRERGGAMVSLIETYRDGGFEPATSELPDTTTAS